MFHKAGLWIPRSGCSCLFPYGSGFMQIRIHECPDPQPCQKRYPSGWNTHGLVSWILISICPCGYGSSSDADPYDLLYGNEPGSGSWISKLLITDPDPRVYKKNPTNIFHLKYSNWHNISWLVNKLNKFYYYKLIYTSVNLFLFSVHVLVLVPTFQCFFYYLWFIYSQPVWLYIFTF